MPRSHYGLMLGLQRLWRVETVKLDVVGKRLELGLEWEREGASQDCPECGRACHLNDPAPERQWRHLDAMGFVTTLGRGCHGSNAQSMGSSMRCLTR